MPIFESVDYGLLGLRKHVEGSKVVGDPLNPRLVHFEGVVDQQ